MAFIQLPVALGVMFFTLIYGVECQSGGSVGAIVSNNDPAIQYAPSFCPAGDISACYGAWWDTTLDDGSTVKTTAGPSPAYNNVQNWLEFSFQGSKIELHGLMDPEGADMMIQLDSDISDINTSTGVGGPSFQPTVLFSKDGLDADVVHTLSVGWVGDGTVDTSSPSLYVYFDHVVVWNYRVVATTTSSDNSTDPFPSQTSFSAGSGQGAATAIASSLPIGKSSAKLSVNPGIFVGVTLACISLIVVFVCGSVLYLRRRRRLRAPSARFKLWVTTHTESRLDGPPSPPLSMIVAKPHMSLPPAYRRETRTLEKTRDGEGAKYKKGISYLELESGSSIEGSVECATPEAQSRLGQGAKVSIPQRPHFKESERSSPYTPFTPYTVLVGQVVHPKYSQVTLVAPNSAENEDNHKTQAFSSASQEKIQLVATRGADISTEVASVDASSSTYISPNGVSSRLETNQDMQFKGSPDSVSVIANMSPRTIGAPPPYDL